MQVNHVLDPLNLGKIHDVLLDLHGLWSKFFENVIAPVSVEI